MGKRRGNTEPSPMPRKTEEERMKINPYKKAEEKEVLDTQNAPSSALQRFLDRRLKKTGKEEQAKEKDAVSQEAVPDTEASTSPDGAADQLSALAKSATLDLWRKQAQALREKTPDFDLEAYTENPVFMALLEDGLSVFDAFEVSRLAENRRNRESAPVPALQRVRENGITASAGITLRPDVSRLTPQERANIARRAANGEKIVL